jgi:hypothetical protein
VQFLHGRYRNHRLFKDIDAMLRQLGGTAPAAP